MDFILLMSQKRGAKKGRECLRKQLRQRITVLTSEKIKRNLPLGKKEKKTKEIDPHSVVIRR